MPRGVLGCRHCQQNLFQRRILFRPFEEGCDQRPPDSFAPLRSRHVDSVDARLMALLQSRFADEGGNANKIVAVKGSQVNDATRGIAKTESYGLNAGRL